MTLPRLFDLRLPGLALQHGGVGEQHLSRGWCGGPKTMRARWKREPSRFLVRRLPGAKAFSRFVFDERRCWANVAARRRSTHAFRTILLVHALTGDARAGGEDGWWGPLIGPGRPLDPNRVRILCFNNWGSNYGSTGPLDAKWPPGTRLTTGDQARALLQALDVLGIDSLDLAAGGSLGGMIVLSLAIQAPARVAQIMPIASAACASSWVIGFNHVARQVIALDPGFSHEVTRGLQIARQLAMLTYRAGAGLKLANGRDRAVKTRGHFAIEGTWSTRV